ncbi:glutathione S-transferase family protein [Sphingomonas sp. G-3-2-10]|uniref:glutathione S-transferase family protein n=1 Tax=Sphingomonas sp. G-3-2-10 TaxID=2728838 RepID=UPI00146F61FC|nr:glutathione S-transferase family protein [Sphingomonas sp. G-3-2-10]NML06501.1 glutathione S-transferase family protein [Sphingomonas sp. G-3-2-10]
MSNDLIFYTNPMSRGQIVRWMLEETGAPYETQVMDYASTMKSDAYLAINPMGKVPAIVHRGKVVTECAAICAYLAEAFPEADLAPTADERADYYRWLFFAAGPLEHAITNNNAKFIPSAEQSRSFGYGSYDQAIDTLAGAVSAHAYIAGDRFTAADVYVGSAVTWGLMFGTLPKLDAFVRYSERVTDRDAYRRGKDKDNALMPQAAPA